MIPPDSPLMMVAPQTRYAGSGSASDGGVLRDGFKDVWSQSADAQNQEPQNRLPEDSVALTDGADDQGPEDTDATDLTEVEIADQHPDAAPIEGDLVSGSASKMFAEAGTRPASQPGAPRSHMTLVESVSRSSQTAVVPTDGQPAASALPKDGLGKPLAEASFAGSPAFSGQLATQNSTIGAFSPLAAQSVAQAAASDGRLNPNARSSVLNTVSLAAASAQLQAPSKTPQTDQHLVTPGAAASRGGRDESIVLPQPPIQTAIATPPLSAAGLAVQAHPFDPLGPDLPVDANQILTAPTTPSQPSSATAAVLTPTSFQHPTVAQQITTAIIQASGRTTEIALNPEELGRVRISLTPADTGMTVTIFSERPETADLMRRNIELLAQEFTDLGYENLSFNFDSPDEGVSDDSQQATPNRTDLDAGAAPNDGTPPPTLSVALTGGLDLKL